MRAPPKTKGAALAQPSGLLDVRSATKPNEKRQNPASGRAQVLTIVGSIREATCLFGEIFYPAGAPLTIGVEQIGELIELLEAAKAVGPRAANSIGTMPRTANGSCSVRCQRSPSI